MNDQIATEQPNEAHISPSELNDGLGLAEFAEMIGGGKLRPYQKEMLDALERGEKMRFYPCTGRRYYEDLYAQWRKSFLEQETDDYSETPNVEVSGCLPKNEKGNI